MWGGVRGRTCDGADHGDRGEGSGEALAAHDGRGVGGGKQAGQSEETALQHGPERWGGGRGRVTLLPTGPWAPPSLGLNPHIKASLCYTNLTFNPQKPNQGAREGGDGICLREGGDSQLEQRIVGKGDSQLEQRILGKGDSQLEQRIVGKGDSQLEQRILGKGELTAGAEDCG